MFRSASSLEREEEGGSVFGCNLLIGRLILRGLTILLAALMAPTGAMAQGLSPTVYVGQSIPLTIPVTASVGGRCQFAAGGVPQGSYDAGSIDTTAWSHDFDFRIDCNTASRVAVVSLNGGLKAATAALDSGYAALAPYTVLINLQGNSQAINADCAVATLAASSGTACGFRGPASTTTGLRLPGASSSQTGSYLRVSAPAYPGPAILVAGAYADTLTVTIAASP